MGLHFAEDLDGVWTNMVRELVDVRYLGKHEDVWRGKSLQRVLLEMWSCFVAS